MNARWLGYRVHPTWHLTFLCGGIVVGLALGSQSWALMFGSLIWSFFAVLLSLLAMTIKRRWLLGAAIIAGIILGLSRGSIDARDYSLYDNLIGQGEVTVSGVISEDIDISSRGDKVIRLGNVEFNDRELPGNIWVVSSETGDARRSDIITVKGNLSEGFGSFGASMFRAEILSVKRPVPGDVALDVRDNFAENVRQGIDEPSASLGIGYLTGQRRALPEELDEALRIAGLTHVVVASGYNLTILVRFVRRLFEKHSRYMTVFFSGLLIISFIAVTGLSPSMSRAGLVAGFALLAWYFGRKFHPITLLLCAAAITGLAQPSYVWGNLGWQLSFAAFAGVMILAPLLQAYFFGPKKPGTLRQIIGETISAQIVTLPLLVISFGYMSTVAVIANALVLPLIPLAMLLTFIAGLSGMMLGPAAEIMALPAQWLLDGMVWVAMTVSNWEWSILELEIGPVAVLISYMIIIAGCWWMSRATGYRLRDSNIIE